VLAVGTPHIQICQRLIKHMLKLNLPLLPVTTRAAELGKHHLFEYICSKISHLEDLTEHLGITIVDAACAGQIDMVSAMLECHTWPTDCLAEVAEIVSGHSNYRAGDILERLVAGGVEIDGSILHRIISCNNLVQFLKYVEQVEIDIELVEAAINTQRSQFVDVKWYDFMMLEILLAKLPNANTYKEYLLEFVESDLPIQEFISSKI